MVRPLSPQHKQTLAEMKLQLTQLGNREAAFINVELLFFKALTLSREYGEDPDTNSFLKALKQVQSSEHAATFGPFQKAKQREITIRKFMGAFRNVLVKCSKDLYVRKEMAYLQNA
ncbi:MAG TPA: hypothetical protein VHK91_14630 [Flavisolibacter sp.]|jgi:hypothetical protein|nr:hypothetical protein [Flavisolibacter sp.]